MRSTRTALPSDRRYRRRRHGRVARRGMALLLVLGVVAIASILSWSMLSSAAMRAQVETTTADATDAQYLAESGISYALYYLRYPAKSPVAVRQGAFDAYFPGQAGVTMWSDARGTVDTSVTNTGDGQFSITSSTTVNGIRRTMIADAAYTYDRYTVTHALAVNGNFAVPPTMTVTGPVVNRGSVTVQGTVTNGGPMTPTYTTNVTPPYNQLTLAIETLTVTKKKPGRNTDRGYTYDGQDYAAELITGTVTGTTLVTGDPDLNPMNVWYADGDVTISNATINGTIVLRKDKKLTVLGTNTIRPKSPDMPALICNTLDLRQSSIASKLTVSGVAYVNDTITNSGQTTDTGLLRIDGALLMGGGTPAIDVAKFKSPLIVTYNASAAKVPHLWTRPADETVTGITVRGWRQGP